jgi:hypothetical protein
MQRRPVSNERHPGKSRSKSIGYLRIDIRSCHVHLPSWRNTTVCASPAHWGLICDGNMGLHRFLSVTDRAKRRAEAGGSPLKPKHDAAGYERDHGCRAMAAASREGCGETMHPIMYPAHPDAALSGFGYLVPRRRGRAASWCCGRCRASM